MFHSASPSDGTLLSAWRWRIGELPTLIGWSSGGDLFIEMADGHIAMIDPGSGDISVVAKTKADFDAELRNTQRAAELLQLVIVEAFEKASGPLPVDRCLGFKQLPILGGSYGVENRCAVPVAEHAGITGDLLRQLRDLPDGAKVSIKIVP